MKLSLLRLLNLLFFIGLFSLSGIAQNLPENTTLKNEQADRLVKGTKYLKTGGKQELPTYVKFKDDADVRDDQFKSWIKKSFDVSQEIAFHQTSEKTDDLGFTHRRYKQTYRGITLDRSDYIVHSKNGKITSYSGSAYKISDFNIKPTLSEEQALQKALDYIGADKYYWESSRMENELKEDENDAFATYYPSGELMISNHPSTDFRLVYVFDIHALEPNIEKKVYVNANSGEIAYTLPLTSNCTSPTNFNSIFNGSQSIRTDKYITTPIDLYRLNDDCQAAEIWVRDWGSTTASSSPNEIISLDNTWTSMDQRFGATVLWQTNESYDYFKNVHSRDSYDDANGNVKAYINAVFCTATDGMGNCTATTTNNASMSFSGGSMKVGLSNAGVLTNSYATLDIIGHEYAHAVTGSSSQLVYQGEPGALNESFSDIFGEMIERRTLGNNDWLIGDERDNGAIRSMSNPNAGNDPDTYQGTNWANTCGMCGDNGGVHTNSGVQNFWFFLLSEGGTGTNDNGDNYEVAAIGEDKAAAIAFRNMTIKLSVNSDYAAARVGAIEAAEELYGECSFEALQVAKAWHAVGVGDPFLDENVPPTIVCPPSVGGFQCAEEIPAPYADATAFVAAGGSLSDNCAGEITLSWSNDEIVNQTCENNFTLQRTYIAEDEAGNQAECIQSFVVGDNTSPQIVFQPQDVTLECDETYNPPYNNVDELFMDNCTDDLDVIGDIVVLFPNPECNYPQIYEYYFVATDECGNSTPISWTVTYEDTEGPVASNLPVDVTLQCDDIAGIAAAEAMNPTFTDNCSPPDSLELFVISAIAQDPNCSNAYVIDRSWWALDDCGNESETVSQTITVIDTIAPTVSDIPEDVTLQCDDAAGIAAAEAMEPTFTDNCSVQDSLNIFAASSLIPDPDCPNAYEIHRSWYADDGCGNVSITVSNTITVVDTERPDLSFCPDLSATIECDADQNETLADQWNADNIATLENCAQDNCTDDLSGLVTSDYDFSRLSDRCGETGLLIVKYTIDDGCGNLSYAYATLTIVDTTDPEIEWNNPLINGQGNNAYLSVECESQSPDWEYPTFAEADVIATDACGSASVQFSENHIEGNCLTDGYMRRFEYEWIATDECGNTSSKSLVVEIDDTQAPTITGVPEDITLSCGQEAFMPEVGFCENESDGKVSFFDACECADMIVEVDTISGNCAGEYLIFRRWTAKDKCGNSTSAEQIVTYRDVTAPEITPDHPELIGSQNEGTIYIECNSYYDPEWIDEINAESMNYTDNCSADNEIYRSYDFTETSLDNNCKNGEIKRYRMEWYAQDDCGNESDYAINVVIVDNTPPTILGVKASLCGESEDPMKGVTAEDNCALAQFYYRENEVFDECLETDVIERIFYASDYCGNVSTETQIVYQESIEDEVDFYVNDQHNWALGDTIMIECGEDLPDIEGAVRAESHCMDMTVIHKLTQMQDCSQNTGRLLQHQWIARSACGEVASASVYVAVLDTTPPEILFENELMVTSCNDIPLPEYTDCSDVDLNIEVDTLEYNCFSDMVLQMNYTAVDQCGNTTVDTQYVRIESAGLEFRNVPEHSCGPMKDVQVQAYDYCSDSLVAVEHITDIVDTCSSGELRVKHMWIAEDACGNEFYVERYEIMNDESAPIIVRRNGSGITVPWSGIMEISCDDQMPEFNSQSVEASDNCNYVQTEFWKEDLTSDCNNQLAEAVRYHWRASDQCGNENHVYVDVHRIDGEKPEIYNVPEDEFIYCGEVPSVPGNVTAWDDCSGQLEMNYSEKIDEYEGRTVYTRQWEAVDRCYNRTAETQKITVEHENDFTAEIFGNEEVACNHKAVPIHVSVEGGHPEYDYQWSVVEGLCRIVSGENEQDVEIQTGFSNSLLKVQVWDGHGCMREDMIEIKCTTEGNPQLFYRDTDTEKLNVQLYPNPTTDQFTIVASVKSQEVNYELRRIDGLLIDTKKVDAPDGKLELTETIGELPAGVYVIRIEDGENRSAYKRLIVQ